MIRGEQAATRVNESESNAPCQGTVSSDDLVSFDTTLNDTDSESKRGEDNEYERSSEYSPLVNECVIGQPLHVPQVARATLQWS